MIISEFYDDFQTFENTKTEEQVILTDTLLNLNVNTADIDKAYLMGYVDPDYVPYVTRISRIDIVSGAGSDYAEFVNVTDKKNIPWMYTAGADRTGSGTTTNTDRIAYYHANDTDGWVLGGYYTPSRPFMKFINSLKISNVASRAYSIEFKAYTINHTDTTINNFWTVGSPSMSFTNTAEFLSWLKGETEKTVNIQIRTSISPTSKEFTVKGTDFANGEFVVEYSDEIADYTTYIYILAVFTDSQRIIWNNGSLGQYPMVSVTYHHTAESEGIDWLYKLGGRCALRFPTVTSGDSNYVGLNISNLFSGTWSLAGQTFVNNDKTYVFGGITGRIPYRWATESAYGSVIKNDRTLFHKYTSSVIRAYVFWLTSDIERWVQQLIRLELTSTLEYGFSDNVGVPKYKTDNSPAWDILTGDFDTIEDELRPWQIDDIKYNPFTIDDVPPYHGGDDGGDDSGGDDIRPSDWTNLRIGAANNFVTLYGMTSETVSDFGRKMWAQLADPEFWKMVGTAFTNDFSINPADMMRYFVSLRYFPFDVSDFAHTTSSGVYIGRAASPIAPSVGVAYPLRLTNSTVQVSGGTVTIPRRYNDFRDYEPCTTVQVHIPFCGSVEIPASEVMGHPLDLTYKIDLQTGAMMGVLCVQSDTYYVIATVAGTVGASIPITANNNIEFLQRIATIGGGLIGGGVSGALKGAMLGGEVGAVVGAVAGTVGGGVGALAGLPPVTVHKQGNASGFANLGGVPYAYATVQRSRFELPDNYGHTTGFACDFATTVGELSGYAVCDNVDTSGLSCNSRERDEIKRLLESGVYV